MRGKSNARRAVDAPSYAYLDISCVFVINPNTVYDIDCLFSGAYARATYANDMSSRMRDMRDI